MIADSGHSVPASTGASMCECICIRKHCSHIHRTQIHECVSGVVGPMEKGKQMWKAEIRVYFLMNPNEVSCLFVLFVESCFYQKQFLNVS